MVVLMYNGSSDNIIEEAWNSILTRETLFDWGDRDIYRSPYPLYENSKDVTKLTKVMI